LFGKRSAQTTAATTVEASAGQQKMPEMICTIESKPAPRRRQKKNGAWTWERF
jgi:hypothetical protein